MNASPRKLRVGVLVNPIAGLGGPAALKGSDDRSQVLELLGGRAWNDEIHAFARGVACLKQLDRRKIILVTAPGVMGEDVVKRATMFGGPVFEIVRIPGWSQPFGSTTPRDTAQFAKRLAASEIDLLLFVGGDGTAVDVSHGIDATLPALGVPAGVKMFSPAFAETPETAAHIVNALEPGFPTEEVDVLDLDEESYRAGEWRVRSQATLRVPEAPGVQLGKGGALGGSSEQSEDLVAWFQEHKRPGVSYVLGSGTTVGAIKRALDGGSPLGVDVYRDGAFVVLDGAETQILEALGEEGEAEILVSITGAQGALLGRGTAQISPAVIERVGPDRVIPVATPAKLMGLTALFVDTGDADVDRSFPEYVKVRTDPLTEKVFPLRRGGSPGR